MNNLLNMEEKIEAEHIENQEADIQEEPKEEAPKGKPKRTPEEELAYFEGRAKRLRKDLGIDAQPEPEKPAPKTDELDYGQKAYLRATLDIKGSEELALVREYVKAGKTLDDIVDNRHFKQDLQDLRDKRAALEATPSSTKRAGSSGSDFDTAYAKYEQTGELPKDFDLRTKVIAAKTAKQSDKTPPWRR